MYGFWRIIFMLLLVLLGSGCTYVTAFNPGYISDPPRADKDKLPGKALVFTDKSDDAYIFSGSPTSFTGGGTTLTSPIGAITKGIALKVFGDLYQDGAVSGNSRDGGAGYAAILYPRTTAFTYEYNQLKNAGFAITPTVVVTLNVKRYASDGAVIFDKTYNSGNREGDSYMVSGEPAEKINKLLHSTLNDLLRQAAAEFAVGIPQGSAAGSVPAPAANSVVDPKAGARVPAPSPKVAPNLDDLKDLLPASN